MPILRKLIKGKTVEEKLDSIEHILTSFRSRLGNKIVGLMPPVVILHNKRVIDGDGRIFAGIMPLNGIVTTVCFSIANYTGKGAIVELSIVRRDSTILLKGFECKREVEVLKPDLPVEVGDILRINAKDPKSISDILIGALIHPAMGETQKQELLLASLEEGEN